MRVELPALDPATAERQGTSHSLDVATEEAGLRIVFDENGSGTEHDLLIERWLDSWALLLHAGGGDPVLVIEIRSDSFEVWDEMRGVLMSTPIAPPQKPPQSS